MSVDCELAKLLVKKFRSMEKRVTFLEGKSRGQQDLIEKLQRKLQKLNKGKLRQGFDGSNKSDELLKTMKKDSKSQKVAVQMEGSRCSEISKVEKKFEEDYTSKSKISNLPKLKNETSKSKSQKRAKKSVCPFCSKSFSNLSNHMRVHTGEKPYKCKICSSSFSLSKTLKRHSLVHTGKRPFSCTYCSKSFADKKTLNDHIRIHTGERPYSCSICVKTFVQSSNLSLHMKIHKKRNCQINK